MKKKRDLKVTWYINWNGVGGNVEKTEEIENTNENVNGDDTNDNVNTEDTENNTLFGKIKKVLKFAVIVGSGYVAGFTGFLSDLLSVIDAIKNFFS